MTTAAYAESKAVVIWRAEWRSSIDFPEIPGFGNEKVGFRFFRRFFSPWFIIVCRKFGGDVQVSCFSGDVLFFWGDDGKIGRVYGLFLSLCPAEWGWDIGRWKRVIGGWGVWGVSLFVHKLQRFLGVFSLPFFVFFSVGSVCSGTESDSIQVVQGFKNLLKGDGLLRNQDSIDWCVWSLDPQVMKLWIIKVWEGCFRAQRNLREVG